MMALRIWGARGSWSCDHELEKLGKGAPADLWLGLEQTFLVVADIFCL